MINKSAQGSANAVNQAGRSTDRADVTVAYFYSGLRHDCLRSVLLTLAAKRGLRLQVQGDEIGVKV